MGTRRHFVNVIFTLTLLGVFAMSAILVAVMGAQVYKHSADNMQATYDTRTSLVYMSQRIRQCPEGGIKISQLAGSDALILSESSSGNSYESWIYADSGYLYEVTVSANTDVKPGDGQRIMKLDSMKLSSKNGLLEITTTNSQGETDSLFIAREVTT